MIVSVLSGLRLVSLLVRWLIGASRSGLDRKVLATGIVLGMSLVLLLALPLDPGRTIEGNGWRVPLAWVLMPWTAWGGLISAIFLVLRVTQMALAVTLGERRQRFWQSLMWSISLAAFVLLHLRLGVPISWYRGVWVVRPETAVAVIAFLVAAVAAMSVASGWARGRGVTKTVLSHLTLLVGTVVFGFPFVWLLSTSFKESRDVVSQTGEIRLMPRVEETVPYFNPDNPLYEAIFEGGRVNVVKLADSSSQSLVVEVVSPVNKRGATFEASLKDLKVIPREAKVVTTSFDGKPIKGFVAEDYEDGRRRVQILEPAELKGVEFVANPAEVEPVMKPGFRWKNYPESLEYLPPETSMGLMYLKNTVILVVMTVIGTILSSAVVAYAFSRMRFPGRAALFTLMVSTMMLPGAVTLLPTFLIFRQLGWIDTLYPLWVPAFFAGAFNVFMLRQFFLTIPKELEEAAKIDGCSYLRSFWQVMLPQVKPALAVIAIWTFMGTWNNFMGPLIYINSPEKMPIAYAVQLFQSQRGGEPALMMAFATMAMLPVLLVFFFAQKYFIEGVTLSGLGGR